MPSPTYTTPVRETRELAPEVREIVLAPPEEPFRFEPGQWIGLHLPVGERPPLVRAYSLAASPSPTGELVLCLDRVPEGLGSDYLFGLKPGDPVTFAGPLGNFTLPETRNELFWIARYTGIVPFRAMFQRLLEQPQPAVPVTLVYSAPRPQDLVYHEEFELVEVPKGWFRYVPLVDDPPPDWGGGTGDVLECLPDLVAGRADLTPMVCGKREFVRAVRDTFTGLGYDRRTVKWENYD